MKTLALEFSSSQRSVAVADANRVLAETIETGGREMRALGLVDRALREAALEREQIERLVVGLGPGSYTSIRTAISLAQGWQLVRGVKLLEVSSAEALAAEAQAVGIRGQVNVVIDAQRNEFYVAGYEIGSDNRREVLPLRLASLGEVQELGKAGGALVGPEVTRWFQGGRILFPRATTLIELAKMRNDFLPGEKLEPIYLRETTFVKAPAPRVF